MLAFVDDLEFESASGPGDVSGLGLAAAGALAAASVLSLLDVVDCVDDFDWERTNGEKKKTNAAASTRDFIILESLLGLSQNSER